MALPGKPVQATEKTVVCRGLHEGVDGPVKFEREMAVDRIGYGCDDGVDLRLVIGFRRGDAPSVALALAVGRTIFGCCDARVRPGSAVVRLRGGYFKGWLIPSGGCPVLAGGEPRTFTGMRLCGGINNRCC